MLQITTKKFNLKHQVYPLKLVINTSPDRMVMWETLQQFTAIFLSNREIAVGNYIIHDSEKTLLIRVSLTKILNDTNRGWTYKTGKYYLYFEIIMIKALLFLNK